MNTKHLSKIFFLSIFLYAFSLAIVAQEEKPRVIEFAQVWITQGEADIDRFIEPLEKFIGCLEKEPDTTKGYIEVPENTELGKKIRIIVATAGLKSRVKFLGVLKYPERYWSPGDINFYLVPQGAEIPYESTLKLCICPTLNVDAPENVINQNSVLTFKAKVGDGDIDGLSYTWQVSAGKIVEGQGTPTIKVDAQGAEEVTAIIKIGGFCETCMPTASNTIRIQQQ